MFGDSEIDENNRPTSGSEQLELTEAFVAPWGLPHEVRPLHAIWSGDIDQIQFKLAGPIELVEGYNLARDIKELDQHTADEDRIVVIDRSELVTPGYVSLKFKIPKKFDESMVGQEIGIDFLVNDEVVESWSGYTFTIRPMLELLEYPDPFVLENRNDVLPISVGYIGFGMAEVQIEISGEGQIITKDKDVFIDMARAILESGIHKKESEHMEDIPEEWKNDSNVKVEREVLEDMADGMRELLTENRDAFEEFDEDELHLLADIFEEGQENREWDISKIYDFIELALINSILDVVEKNPTEGVHVANPNVEIDVEGRLTEAQVEYHLRDKYENEYDPLVVTIPIEDARDSGGHFNIEIDTDWKSHEMDPNEVLQEILEEI